VVRAALVAEGVTLHEKTGIARVAAAGNGIEVSLEPEAGQPFAITGTHVLIAAGRKANVDNLGLEAAGIKHTPRGIEVDARLRTANPKVFAIGDVAGGPQFTHIAGYHAGIVIRNALFGLPAKVDYAALPWVTYTDPELAHVGLTEADARKAGHDVQILTGQMAGNDRAQAEQATEGLAKIVLGKGGRILGATLVGPHAGELIAMWGLAISQKAKIGALASMIVPYPTLSDISKRTAGSYYTPTLYGPRTRKFVQFVQRFLP
jgi:pyruvate/2-oxoglutarate dehydrogenase complex dihydrolipoamide dehydrogenase (E3) component